jgi:serine/threonine-protein kinase
MSPQQTIAHYRITAKLGEGGMGEVWRATDTKLGRDVALKMVPASFARDPARMARFEREAKALASLNHPHIAQIYGMEEGALVMELVEGQPLKGPLLVEKAIEYAGQILDALDAAHKKGIVHRDLKPANILVTRQGIKLLDFGLAKLKDASIAESDETVTQGLTQQGQIVGTLQYMSPEQLNGKEIDSRSDLFSFGCVMYEMLSGTRAFDGKSAASVIAAVLEREPEPLRAAAPLERVIRRALAKDPEQRFQTARDLKAALSWALENAPALTGRARNRWRITAAVLATVAFAASWIAWQATRPVIYPLTRLSVDLGSEALPGLSLTVAISPDGRRLVFPARGPDGKQQLATRLLEQAQPTLLPGTEGGRDPFFSPDGQWIGFFNEVELKKVSVLGGAALAVGGASNNMVGASWGEDGFIVYAPGSTLPLVRIPDAGGIPQAVTRLAAAETTHRWPQVLPGGGAVLFTASPSVTGMENANIEAISLKTGQVKVLERGGYYGRYLPSGHLVFIRQGVLFGVKFEPARLELHGTPVPLLDDVAATPFTGGGQFDFSGAPSGPGTFVYSAGKTTAQAWQLAWLDGSGKVQPLIAALGAYGLPRLSPDGQKVAVVDDRSDVYIHDVERNTARRLTFTGDSNVPIWARDGKHILFAKSANSIVWMRSDGAGEPIRLLESPNLPRPWSVSPDGRQLAYLEQTPETGLDLWTLPLDLADPEHPKAGKPEPFLRTPANELLPQFSPDGRWIAYRSEETGSSEIYVRPFPAASKGKWQISTGGGLYACWSNNGRELFYETTDHRIMVVAYTMDGSSFMPGEPRLWSDTHLFYTGTSNLDLAPDGKRFIVLALPEAASTEKGSVRVTMLLNFFDELKRKIP